MKLKGKCYPVQLKVWCNGTKEKI